MNHCKTIAIVNQKGGVGRPKSGMNPFPGKKASSTAARGSICFLRTLNCPAWK